MNPRTVANALMGMGLVSTVVISITGFGNIWIPGIFFTTALYLLLGVIADTLIDLTLAVGSFHLTLFGDELATDNEEGQKALAKLIITMKENRSVSTQVQSDRD